MVGQRLGPYELRAVIGQGGTATVYEGYQRSLSRTVAVKVLTDLGDPQFVARFQREAQLIAKLAHPNIVQIYDFGHEDGVVYLVLQYVEGGRTMADLTGAPLAPARAVELVTGLLAGLGHAHAQGLVHHEVKPSNVLLAGRNWPLLADFGIGRLTRERAARLTATGRVLGTAAYLSPEHALGVEVDARADLYSAGVVLYELLTGQVPFRASAPTAVLMQHAYKAVPPPRELDRELPTALKAVLLRALAKRPGDRYQRAEEMADALRAAMLPAADGAIISHHRPLSGPCGSLATGAFDAPARAPTASPALRATPARRRRWPAVACGILIVALLVLLATRGWGRGLRPAGSPEILAEPAQEPGPDPFTPDAAAPAVPVVGFTAARDAPGAERAPQLERSNGAAPGLYGGTRGDSRCGRAQISAYLDTHPGEASAWVEALNRDATLRWSGGDSLGTDRIPSYFSELTPVLLRMDTRVTNFGLRGGHPTARQSLLQAGTAVLVDASGVPRVRCRSGSPLLPADPVAAGPVYAGTRWPGFSTSRRILIDPSPQRLEQLTLIDLRTGERFQRPIGSIGDRDLDEPRAPPPSPPVTHTPIPPSPTRSRPPGPKAPAAPSNLRVTAIDPTRIRLDWSDDSSDESGFQISNGDIQVTVGAGVETYTWRGLAPETYMCFRVRAINAAANSAFIPSASPYYECARTPPAAVTVTVTVPSTVVWVDTGIVVRPGQSLEITATGLWTSGRSFVGPDGYADPWADNFFNLDDLGACGICATTPAPHHGALVGYLGDAPPAAGSYRSKSVRAEARKVFLVGSSLSRPVTETGRLWLAFNTAAYSARTRGNVGEVTVTITVAGLPPGR